MWRWWSEVSSFKTNGYELSISLGKGKKIIVIGQVGMALPTRIVCTRVRVMIRSRLEVIDIYDLLTSGKGKRVPNWQFIVKLQDP